MARVAGGRTVLLAAFVPCVLGGIAAFVALVGPAPPDVAPRATVRDGAPGATEDPRPRRETPRRNRVAVLHDAQREAADAAAQGLDAIAAARRAARAAPAAPAAPGSGPEEVLVLTRHPDGREFRRGRTRSGERDGLWTETFESGARVETVYRMGVRHGREAAWHPDGRPRFLGEYDEGEMSGTWTAWHANGRVLSTRQYRAGRLQGWMRTFHENGALAEEACFEDGAESGVNRGWHSNGHLAWEIVYVAGEREGPATWYGADGRLLAQGTYVAGALHGTYVEYAADGTVKRTERWDRGHRVALAD